MTERVGERVSQLGCLAATLGHTLHSWQGLHGPIKQLPQQHTLAGLHRAPLQLQLKHTTYSKTRTQLCQAMLRMSMLLSHSELVLETCVLLET